VANEEANDHHVAEVSRLLGSVAENLALAGGIVMVAAALLVCISVTLRWATSNSIPGDFELVQIAVAVSAFAFLPFCQVRRGNITVNTFTTRLPAWARNSLDALWDLVYALAAGFIAWRLSIGAAETIANRTTTMVSGLPIGWAIAATSAMAVLLAVAALATAWQLARRRT
jgi:TRAP-type C4-dicarboxylate transport system permease small subunit